MFHPLVSVVIPVYNIEEYISDCLDSVLNQVYDNLEIIVINDCSTDDTESIIHRKLQNSQFNTVIINNQINSGVSVSRNKGLEVCKGEYICFIDGDDVIDKSFISNLVISLSLNPKDYLMVCSCESIDSYAEANLGEKNNKFSVFHCSKKADFLRVHGYPVGILYSRDIIKRYNLSFPVGIKYMEDCIFNSQYLRQVSKISIVESAVYYILKRKGSASRPFDKEKLIIEGVKCIRKFDELFINDNIPADVDDLLLERRYIRNCHFGDVAYAGFKYTKRKNYYYDSKTLRRMIYKSKLSRRDKFVELMMSFKIIEYYIYKIALTIKKLGKH